MSDNEQERDPDVLLDIPKVSVDSIRLAVDELDADVSLRTRLANLLELDAGVRVHLKGVELDITGVHAEALLKVRLEKLVEILDRALTTIDRNPQVIDALSRTATAVPADVNRAPQPLAEPTPLAAPLERAGGATDDLGQQVGAIGAVADRPLRGRGGPETREPGQAAPGQGGQRPGGEGGGQRPGSEGGGQRPGGEELGGQRPGGEQHGGQRPGGEERSGGGERGEQHRGGAGGGQRSGGEGGGQESGRAEQSAQQPGGERVGGAGGGATPGDVGTGGPEAGKRAPSAGPAEGGSGRQPETSGGAQSAAQLAEQAGETLRQAGRSVWEAIQGGMSQHRQQRH